MLSKRSKDFEFSELEQRLQQDAARLGGPAPDLLSGLEFEPRPASSARAARSRVFARAAVSAALAMLLLAGAEDRAGMQGAGRFISAAKPHMGAPVAPAAAVKDVAAFLSGAPGTPLEDEWDALAQDAEVLFEELTRRVAPLANVGRSDE